MSVRVLTGDCLELMATLPEESIDSIVTDPPYHLTSIVKRFGSKTAAPAKSNGATGVYARASAGFMGQTWDGGDVAFRPETWAEAFRVLKPGGYLLAFSGTRTYHRMVCAIEDAGFDIRDQIGWTYGSGFPKSLNVSKAIDATLLHGGSDSKRIKSANDGRPGEGRVRNSNQNNGIMSTDATGARVIKDESVTPEAAQWEGWGTALKPAQENICWAQKPYDLQQLCAMLAHKLTEAICLLPSLAKDAEPSSRLNQSVFAEAFGSAQWNAVVACNTPADLFALMGTWPSGSDLPSSLSTAFSWLNTLAEASALGSTFTTETASSLITDLRTLNSLLSKSTPHIIVLASIPESGTPQTASLAASLFSAVSARLACIRGLSVLDPAIADGDRWDIRPNWESICVARKPFPGTVAANVLEHGTGAMNIDGCRVETADVLQMGKTGLASEKFFTKGGAPEIEKHRHSAGRWPANLVTSCPEDEYEIRGDVTPEQQRELFGWLHANA
jgi:hypothetical protein